METGKSLVFRKGPNLALEGLWWDFGEIESKLLKKFEACALVSESENKNVN